MKYFFYPERRFVTFAPIMSNNPKSPIIDLQQQQLLLRMEYEYEKEEFKRQTETMGVARKVKRGLCWYPVSLGRSYYNSLNQLVIDITRTENKEIEHSFEFGRPVCFFHQSFEGKVKYMDFIATISFADEERMVVVLPGAGALAELQTDGILGVQLYFDETSYRAMFEALEDTIRAKDNRLAELRDILLGTQKPGFRELYPVRFPWLNSTQETAVNKVLCTRDVSIVHGPPGTGKTTTLVEAIYETLHREPQVLVCAQSNTAVDWICEKLVDRGVPVLRIGNPTRVNDKMLSSTYERRFESHPAYPELWGIRKSIREMGSRMRRGSYSEREGMRNRMSRLRDRATELEIQINADLFDSARVIASTLVSSNHRLLNGRRFSTLFIDEAAQALEAACWIAIRKADRVIAKMVQYHDFDIFGTQECFLHQLKDMKEALPGYDYIGVGRDDGKTQGEHSAIFYRTDKFDIIEKGDFWLSETPDVPSKGWDAVLPRICSWGHFKCKDTGFEFLFFNLHMDHIGKKARVESAYLVQEKMKELGKGKNLPAILTGDFNVDQTHQSYNAFVEKGVLCDSYEKCDFRYATNGTFNSFNPNSFTESRIDHVFVSPAFHVKRYGILTDTYRSIVGNGEKENANDCPEEIDIKAYQARTPSDHFPVKVELEFDERQQK